MITVFLAVAAIAFLVFAILGGIAAMVEFVIEFIAEGRL